MISDKLSTLMWFNISCEVQVVQYARHDEWYYMYKALYTYII
jgi:hypothetical protein